ncbi:UNVERIFIED_CONTAM: hypothetical protein Sindi_2424100 [Sesamum indicum]
MNIDRSWMWKRLDDNGFLLDEFVTKVDQEFLNFAYDNPRFLNNGQIKCPCSKCRNTRFLNRSDAHLHIVKNGFARGYNIWYAHGESLNTRDNVGEKLNELTKVVGDMRSNATKMEEEFFKTREENKKLLEIALEEARKREEEARKRETNLQELV